MNLILAKNKWIFRKGDEKEVKKLYDEDKATFSQEQNDQLTVDVGKNELANREIHRDMTRITVWTKNAQNEKLK